MLYILLSLEVTGQICNGNIGDNIFTKGDFGSGELNTPEDDPGIAPGYNYTRFPPPNDGYYTITNNTSEWGDFAECCWINIQDNSDDPNGYMMVVNASIEPGLFYEEVVDNLCEEVTYEFSADIVNLNTTDGIQPNVSFLLDGRVVYETGLIPETGQWITYGFTFTTRPGQSSLTLSLRNNAMGGIGNDLALDNITFRPCGPEALILPVEVANICEDGEPITLDATIIGREESNTFVQWQQSFDEGETWQDIEGETGLSYPFTNLSSGTYDYRYLLANTPDNLSNSQCRTNSNVKQVRVIPKFVTITDSICEGIPFDLGGRNLDSSGIYIDTLRNTLGCDSIVTVDLTIMEDTGLETIVEIQKQPCSYEEKGVVNFTIRNGYRPLEIMVNGRNDFVGNILNLFEGVYQFEVTDRYGCYESSDFEIIKQPPFLMNLGEDIVIHLGETISIQPIVFEKATSFKLWPERYIRAKEDSATFYFTPTHSGYLYGNAVSEAHNCLAGDSLFVEVIPVRKVYIPNLFIPNGDGKNDFFTVYGETPNVQSIENLVIVDRFGNKVFENSDFKPGIRDEGWDGTQNGRDLPTGIYYYGATVHFYDNERLEYQGYVSLRR